MIKFSLTLSDLCKATNARQQIIDYLAERGLRNTGGGLVTLSFEGEPEAFDEVFESSVRKLPDPLPRTPGTVGADAPFQDPPVTVPGDLEPLVDHVSITPPAKTFRNGKN